MNIAIAGYGREGKSNYEYWARQSDVSLTIVDENLSMADIPTDAQAILGEGAFSKLEAFDMVVRTAGLAPYKIKTNGKIWSATNEFFAQCPAPIIGVTGTKGKGTTASFIASIMRSAGETVWLVGNIGQPSLDTLPNIQPNDIVIYELSSFQLWDLEKSPHIAVVLGVEPEHLDVHVDFQDYLQAKMNIRRHQTANDMCFYYADNEYALQIAATADAPKQAYGFNAADGAHVKGDMFYVGEHIICSTSEVTLLGQHNIENACAAVAVTHMLGVSNDDIAAGLRNFKGLGHRLQFVHEIDGVKFYDDSIATTPSASIAALRSFNDHVVVILGGASKGADYTALAKEVAKRDVDVLLMGKEAETIEQSLKQQQVSRFSRVSGPFAETVKAAYGLARHGSVVLLSPACASFDMFKDYIDRGDQFTAAARALEKAE